MKTNLPVTNVEREFSKDDNILSTTDLKGTITYVNSDFVKICGFEKSELLHKNHNVVRHPDMPPAAFDSLWSTLKENKPWMGIVKNRCKNGDHYWVDAFVTPIEKGGTTIEYQSVRFKPEKTCVERAESLYKKIQAGKYKGPSLYSKFGLKNKFRLWNLISLTPLAVAALLQAEPLMIAICLGLSACLSLVTSGFLLKPMDALLERAKKIFSNPIMSKVYTGRDDEFGHLQLALKMRRSQLNAVVGRIYDSSDQLYSSVNVTINTAQEASEGVSTQQGEVLQVSTAMTEMAATVQEIARNAGVTVDHTSIAKNESQSGQDIVHQTIESIDKMTTEIQTASEVIEKLSQYSENIGGILDVIKGVAEQTNLLALNAAIEAARAGEQGRGFAVVADEVRTLAGRTQESTQEIETMIEHIQNSATESVQAMESSCEKADVCRSVAANAKEALQNISTAINTINDMAYQIATASEEQSSVAEEINRNISSINQVAESNANGTEKTVSVVGDMEETIQTLNSLVDQFMDKRD